MDRVLYLFCHFIFCYDEGHLDRNRQSYFYIYCTDAALSDNCFFYCLDLVRNSSTCLFYSRKTQYTQFTPTQYKNNIKNWVLNGNCKSFLNTIKQEGEKKSQYPYLERRVKGVVHAWVLRLHLGWLSAKAYLVPVLTGLREGRGEPYRQCQSKTVWSVLFQLSNSQAGCLFNSHFSPSPQYGSGLPARLIEEGPVTCYCRSAAQFLVGLWTVDRCPFSPTGIVLLCKVTPVIPW